MFESLFSFVSERVRELTPFRIIRSYERGVKFRFGVVQPVAVLPGFHWRVPGYEEIETVTVVQDAIEFSLQSVLTKDRISVDFQLGLTFEIEDAVAYYTKVTDFHSSLQTICQLHMANKVGEMTFDELCDNRKALEESLRRSLGQRVSRWGVQIVEAGLTNFQKIRGVHLFGNVVRW